MNSPTFMAIWLYIIGMIPIGVASIKNKASAAKFIAVFNHGIEVLSLAVIQLQAVVDAPEAPKVAKMPNQITTQIIVANAKQERGFIETVRQLVA